MTAGNGPSRNINSRACWNFYTAERTVGNIYDIISCFSLYHTASEDIADSNTAAAYGHRIILCLGTVGTGIRFAAGNIDHFIIFSVDCTAAYGHAVFICRCIPLNRRRMAAVNTDAFFVFSTAEYINVHGHTIPVCFGAAGTGIRIATENIDAFSFITDCTAVHGHAVAVCISIPLIRIRIAAADIISNHAGTHDHAVAVCIGIPLIRIRIAAVDIPSNRAVFHGHTVIL